MQQPTQAFSLESVTRLTTHSSRPCDASVVETLMIPLGVLVGEALVDRMRQGAFAQHNHPCQGFFPTVRGAMACPTCTRAPWRRR